MAGYTSSRECDLRHESVEKHLNIIERDNSKLNDAHIEMIKALTSVTTILQKLEKRMESQESYRKEAAAKPKRLVEEVKIAVVVVVVTTIINIIFRVV